MTNRKKPDAPQGLAHDDPRKPLKVRRLQDERERIVGFSAREPQLEDPDFEEWSRTVHSLLVELFGAGEFTLRFKQLKFRPISYFMGGRAEWYGDPRTQWQTSLRGADKILREAVEEAGVQFPAAPLESESAGHRPSVVVNVSNQNVFSPTVHVSVSQLLERLGELPLSASEREIASEHVRELDQETKGEKRWAIIARSVESLKSLGKGVYKEIAVPLLVEFLKHEAGL